MLRITNVLAVFTLACVAYVGWLAFQPEHDVKDATGSGEPDSYSDLSVVEDESGQFAGTIRLENVHDVDAWALVSVNLYDGDQNVGEISGDVVLKPSSESLVDLSGFDDFVDFDEARVDVDMLPH